MESSPVIVRAIPDACEYSMVAVPLKEPEPTATATEPLSVPEVDPSARPSVPAMSSMVSPLTTAEPLTVAVHDSAEA